MFCLSPDLHYLCRKMHKVHRNIYEKVVCKQEELYILIG